MRYPLADVLQRCADLDKSYDAVKSEWTRKPTLDQRSFIRNESLLSLCDFRYWSERYAFVPTDGGGLSRFKPWQSQEIILDRYLSPVEFDQWDKERRGDIAEGIRLVLHKARQLGATMLSRVLTMHRMIFGKYLNAIGASVDEKMVKELYDRDKLIYDHLPFWMRPSVRFDAKSAHIHFSQDTKIIYEQSNQVSGLGTGRQFHISHLTECSSWKIPGMIEFDFFPTIPLAHNSLSILESTANGRDNWWHEFTEDTRLGKHPEWTYIFIPWYACLKDEAKHYKYALTAPTTWQPSSLSLLHAKRVHDTSPTWTGSTIELTRDQLYWYERQRESYRESGKLNFFLTSYCAEPAESFQHSTVPAFNTEMLERIRLGTSIPPTVYEVEHLR